MAPHCPRPPAATARTLSRGLGIGRAAAKPGAEGGPGRKCLSAAGRAGAVRTRGTSGSGLAAAGAEWRCPFPLGLPGGHLTAPGVPAPEDVPGLTCHVIPSPCQPEMACVLAVEIPAVGNVASPGSEDKSGLQ